VFDRVKNGKISKSSAFWRLKLGTQPKRSVFTRIKSGEELASSPSAQEKGSVFGRLSKINKVQSVIPSHMKRLSTLDVKTEGSLRVKRHTVVFTGHRVNPGLKEELKQEEQASSNHIIVQEVDDSDAEIELTETPKTLEDGGQATVDELKELNLGTNEEPCPICVSSLLTPKEEKEYFDLLSEYKDVFAWRYKEMPGLDPKVVVYRLSIKRGVSLKRQSQQCFQQDSVPKIKKEVNKLIEARFIREVKYPI